MASYDSFAEYYDRFTEDVDYCARSAYIMELFRRYDRLPALLLDLACGTGGFSFALAKAGMEVIGVDPSAGMLAAARDKQPPGSENPLFLQQSAEELELFGTVDGAVCMLDSLNHITEYASFCRALERVSLFLEKDRLFIFDMNTQYKHETVLANNAFVREDEDAFCVWQNEYCGDGLVQIYLDTFVSCKDGRYTRVCEDFAERAYSNEQIQSALARSGMTLLAVLEDMRFSPPSHESERQIYIARKI